MCWVSACGCTAQEDTALRGEQRGFGTRWHGERPSSGVPPSPRGCCCRMPPTTEAHTSWTTNRAQPCLSQAFPSRGEPFFPTGFCCQRQGSRAGPIGRCCTALSRGPASLRCSSPCGASRSETLSVLQLFTASSFCKRCTHQIFFFFFSPSLPPFLSLSSPRRCSDSAPHSARRAGAPTCAHAAQADPRAGSLRWEAPNSPPSPSPAPLAPGPGRGAWVNKELGGPGEAAADHGAHGGADWHWGGSP